MKRVILREQPLTKTVDECNTGFRYGIKSSKGKYLIFNSNISYFTLDTVLFLSSISIATTLKGLLTNYLNGGWEVFEFNSVQESIDWLLSTSPT